MLPLALLLLAQSADPLDPATERASFRLQPGFGIELVISEPHARKIVDVAFDDAGRMWAVTASEYPVDGNEDPRAAQLYRDGGRDQVLVIERPWEGTCTSPRVFADGLAMPMAVLPLEHAAIVQHGSEILKLVDDDRDGRADRREVLLTGFGIEDSHLLPHRFLRAPDGWVYMAQGAFNHSRVIDRSGRETRFDQCKVGRFRLDGSRFECIGVGLNNIWGLVFDEHGEFLAQEANDMGYGVVPFVLGATYPGIGQHRFRPWAPVQPPGTSLRFGGTGLSGLAYTSAFHWSPAGAPREGRTVVLANPIERKVQAVRWHGRGPESRFTALPDLVTTDDARFRPVAVHCGPDESLYVVDWYNPIISHNEVPRTHPDRDRVRTRVWRLRHEAQGEPAVPDMTRASEAELAAALCAPGQFGPRAAWHQIVDRGLVPLAPALEAIVLDATRSPEARARALWSLEGLGRVSARLATSLATCELPELRRAAIRGLGASSADADSVLALAGPWAADPDVEVRCERLRALALLPVDDERVVEQVLARVPAPDRRSSVVAEQDRVVALTGESLAAMHERMWVRIALEGREATLERVLERGAGLSGEARALAALALGPDKGAPRLAAALDALGREAEAEELALLARALGGEGVLAYLLPQLSTPERARRVVDAVASARPESLDESARAALSDAALRLGDARLLVRVASVFEARELAEGVVGVALDAAAPRDLRRDALRTLQRLRHAAPEACAEIVDQSLPTDELQGEALLALSSAGDPESIAAALERIPAVPRVLAQRALAQLALSRSGAEALLRAFGEGELELSLASERLLSSVESSLEHPEALAALRSRTGLDGQIVLALSGSASDALDTDLSLSAPFTIEGWVQVREGVDNRDGLLALPGKFDFNFAGGQPRLYLGPERGDVIIARARLEPGRWTHVALTAGADGMLRTYIDGVLDREVRAEPIGRHDGLDVGRTTPGRGSLSMCEVRVWTRERSARELALEFTRKLDGARPDGLLGRYPGDPARLDGGAKLERTLDAPPLLDEAAHAVRTARFERYTQLAQRGDASRGPAVFAKLCANCHSIGGVGESVGPPLDGIASRGIEGILAAVLEPSAAIEAGYRVYRVDLHDDTALEGLLVRSEETSITLRPANSGGAQEPRTIPRAEIARVRAMRLSVMPEGQLETLGDADAADLLAYLIRR